MQPSGPLGQGVGHWAKNPHSPPHKLGDNSSVMSAEASDVTAEAMMAEARGSAMTAEARDSHMALITLVRATQIQQCTDTRVKR